MNLVVAVGHARKFNGPFQSISGNETEFFENSRRDIGSRKGFKKRKRSFSFFGAGWRGRLTDKVEYALHGGGLGDKGDDPHLGPTNRTNQGEDLVNASQ